MYSLDTENLQFHTLNKHLQLTVLVSFLLHANGFASPFPGAMYSSSLPELRVQVSLI